MFPFAPHNNSDRSGSKYFYLCLNEETKVQIDSLPNTMQWVNRKIEIEHVPLGKKVQGSHCIQKLTKNRSQTYIKHYKTSNYETSR